MESEAEPEPNEIPANPWRPAPFRREDLIRALLEGKVAGEVTSHDRHNVRWKIKSLVAGDAYASFGLRDLPTLSREEVLELVAAEAGFDADPLLRDEPVPIDPELVLRACERAGDRLALAAERGERVILATGHPAGLPLLYTGAAELLAEHGAKLLRPLEGEFWHDGGQRRQVRYLRGVAVLTDRARTLHSHEPEPMERMLEEERPDLVFADHGFAGAAIQAGIETICIADINDPALVVAKSQGRTEHVIVMDDNVQPDAYWPCYQAIASRFPSPHPA